MEKISDTLAKQLDTQNPFTQTHKIGYRYNMLVDKYNDLLSKYVDLLSRYNTLEASISKDNTQALKQDGMSEQGDTPNQDDASEQESKQDGALKQDSEQDDKPKTSKEKRGK